MKLYTINHLTFAQVETFYEQCSIGHTFGDIGDFIESAKANNWLFNMDSDKRGEMILQIFMVHEVVSQ